MDIVFYVTEIYGSLQGESTFTGRPCGFVRLSGCPLRCRWCDTVYSFKEGHPYTLEQLVDAVLQLKLPLVEITGGEPLAQKDAPLLMERLLEKGLEVLLETSGAYSLAPVPTSVVKIMDLKCPASGMSHRNLWENIQWLAPHDEIKFVVACRSDFDWALERIQTYSLDTWTLLFSPAWGLVSPKDLAEWLLASGVKGRLNLQTHKYIWGPKTKGV
jgi:7-carboxy-7-deazaguanine synthase